MSAPGWLVRPARETRADRRLLESFECADGRVDWQREVEVFVRETLFSWAFDANAAANDPRVLLVFARSRRTLALVGLAAHERVQLTAGRAHIEASKLEVVAVARSHQGRRFATGERVSDVVMSAAMADIAQRVPPRDARVLAVVHEENARSLSLCARHGLTLELSRPADFPQYRRLVTAHKPVKRRHALRE